MIDILIELDKMRDDIKAIRDKLLEHKTTINEYMLLNEAEDRIVDSMIDKVRGK